MLLKQLDTRRVLVPVPFFVWEILATAMTLLSNPPLTRDQVKLMKRNNIVGKRESTLADLGIRPVSVEKALPTYIKPIR